jgi:hypothetical protein
VLYAENELFGAELTATAALAQRYAELVNVYKALGGGWVDMADPLGPRPEVAGSAGAITGTSPAAGSSAAGGAATGMSSQAAPARRQDRVEVVMEGDSSVVNVYHVLGIGGLAMRAPASGWPPGVVVRLHGFPALESFTATAAEDVFRCELQRPEGRAPQQACRLNGKPADALRGSGGLYEVKLPTRLISPSRQAVEIRWVDQWR